jgi:hypothetical protein
MKQYLLFFLPLFILISCQKKGVSDSISEKTSKGGVGSVFWSKTYGGAYGDVSSTVVPTGDGGYLAIGGTMYGASGPGGAMFSDGLVIKVDANGNKVWQKTYGGSYADELTSAAATPDGGYILAGSSSSQDGDIVNFHGMQDMWVMKINASGDKVWSKTFGGNQDDIAYAVLPVADGYIVAGTTKSSDGDVHLQHGVLDAWVIKLGMNGNLLWEKTFGGSGYDMANGLVKASGNTYLFAGSSDSNDQDVQGGHGNNDAWVVQFDGNGNLIQQKTFGGSKFDAVSAIKATVDKGYILAGRTMSEDTGGGTLHGEMNGWAMKLDGNLNVLWQSVIGGNTVDQFEAVTEGADGSYLLAGNTSSSDLGVGGLAGNTDGWVVTLDKNGHQLGQKRFGGSSSDDILSIVTVIDGFVFSGLTKSSDGDVTASYGGGDLWVAKFKK